MMVWIYAHPLLVCGAGSVAAIAAAVLLLEWDAVRSARPGSVPDYMVDWFRR